MNSRDVITRTPGGLPGCRRCEGTFKSIKKDTCFGLEAECVRCGWGIPYPMLEQLAREAKWEEDNGPVIAHIAELENMIKNPLWVDEQDMLIARLAKHTKQLRGVKPSND